MNNYTVYTILSRKSLKILYSIKNTASNSDDIFQHVLLYTRNIFPNDVQRFAHARARTKSHQSSIFGIEDYK